MSAIPEAEQTDQPAPFVPPTPEALEQLLPRYAIHTLIAHGGMGAVYSGVQRDLERPVAIKVLPPDAGRDTESLDRFRTEAKAMARLTHPNIPAVYDFGVVEGFCVLVMELVEGPNVFAHMSQGQLQPAQALDILAQVCEAVHFAHSRGVIHGDIKPGNILLNQDGQVKLADFGLARLMVHDDRTAEAWTPMGTPEYAAPELYDKNAVADHRADIYSLGVVLCELLTGTPPVGEFELPGEALGLDPRVDEVIARCMELSPENRYQSVQEVRAVLRDIIEGRNVPVQEPVKAPTKRILRATRRTPVGAKKRPAGSQKIAPATQAKLAAGPATVARPPAVQPRAGKRRKVIVTEGGTSRGGMSDAVKRNILIGAAFIVVVAAVYLMATGGGKKAPGAPGEKKAEVVEKVELPDKPAENIPVPGNFQASTPPPVPPPVPQPKPEPKPEPKPAPAVEKPTAAFAKIHELRISYRDEWNSRVEDKLNDALDRLSGQYAQALQKLEDEYMRGGDAANVLIVRGEVERFKKSREAVKPEAVSSNKKIAAHQQSLNIQVGKLRVGLKYDADSVKEKYMLALRELERKMDEAEDKTGSQALAAEFQQVAPLTGEGLKSYFNAE